MNRVVLFVLKWVEKWELLGLKELIIKFYPPSIERLAPIQEVSDNSCDKKVGIKSNETSSEEGLEQSYPIEYKLKRYKSMAKITNPEKPLADVNVLTKNDGTIEIVACFTPDPDVLVGEGESRVALALDASRSIKEAFGGGVFSPTPNHVQNIARKLGSMLCDMSRNGDVSIFYWAVGPRGDQIEQVGDYDTNEIDDAKITGPKKWGGGTHILPAVKNIVENIGSGSDWTMGVIITDGIIEDEQELIDYCTDMGNKIKNGRIKDTVKFVIIGVGEEVDEGQLERIDDMHEDTALQEVVDFFSCATAKSMQSETDIIDVLFGELMTEDMIIAPSGRVTDSDGTEIISWADGLPGKIRFVLPKQSTSFTVHTPHGDVTQDITSV